MWKDTGRSLSDKRFFQWNSELRPYKGDTCTNMILMRLTEVWKKKRQNKCMNRQVRFNQLLSRIYTHWLLFDRGDKSKTLPSLPTQLQGPFWTQYCPFTAGEQANPTVMKAITAKSTLRRNVLYILTALERLIRLPKDRVFGPMRDGHWILSSAIDFTAKSADQLIPP